MRLRKSPDVRAPRRLQTCDTADCTSALRLGRHQTHFDSTAVVRVATNLNHIDPGRLTFSNSCMTSSATKIDLIYTMSIDIIIIKLIHVLKGLLAFVSHRKFILD